VGQNRDHGLNGSSPTLSSGFGVRRPCGAFPLPRSSASIGSLTGRNPTAKTFQRFLKDSPNLARLLGQMPNMKHRLPLSKLPRARCGGAFRSKKFPHFVVRPPPARRFNQQMKTSDHPLLWDKPGPCLPAIPCRVSVCAARTCRALLLPALLALLTLNLATRAFADCTDCDATVWLSGRYWVGVSNELGDQAGAAMRLVVPTPVGRLLAPRIVANTFQSILSGLPTGAAFAVEASSDLLQWQAVETNTSPGTNFLFTTPVTGNSGGVEFYGVQFRRRIVP
jgi:hypothetical protein